MTKRCLDFTIWPEEPVYDHFFDHTCRYRHFAGCGRDAPLMVVLLVVAVLATLVSLFMTNVGAIDCQYRRYRRT
ncbi:MAG TPA: hypothetical protein ENN40_03075 [Candidatus Aminicenantes bacterium]|nr:hypothetical protein [Candidatus Aminicenantes bacterium]